MGQAFDDKGNVLGEAFGPTKAAVAKELEDRFGEQIAKMEIRNIDAGTPGAETPALANDPLLQFFRYEHLPERLRAVSRPFRELAIQIVTTSPRNPERTVALRKLLEAKDCAVRAVLFE